MMWALIGLGAGAGWVLLGHALPALTAPLRGTLASLNDATTVGVSSGVDALGLGSHTQLAQLLGAVAALLAPGLVMLTLVHAIRASRSACTAVSAALAATALGSFLLVPVTEALPLLLAAGALMLVLTAGTRRVTRLPAGVAVGATAMLMIELVRDHDPAISRAVSGLVGVGGDPGLWSLVAAGLALAPLAAAAVRLTRA